jgi:hypothetical protein
LLSVLLDNKVIHVIAGTMEKTCIKLSQLVHISLIADFPFRIPANTVVKRKVAGGVVALNEIRK